MLFSSSVSSLSPLSTTEDKDNNENGSETSDVIWSSTARLGLLLSKRPCFSCRNGASTLILPSREEPTARFYELVWTLHKLKQEQDKLLKSSKSNPSQLIEFWDVGNRMKDVTELASQQGFLIICNRCKDRLATLKVISSSFSHCKAAVEQLHSGKAARLSQKRTSDKRRYWNSRNSKTSIKTYSGNSVLPPELNMSEATLHMSFYRSPDAMTIETFGTKKVW
ncbi:hypothetical protein M231_02784 [Tremella mesenterica]|uniref:Uncharacterized protein n=1 Tax=Tremella mesenterica TaxID=5217 RepID=A0A4Q1BPZ8_TREME|nr:hypothetical protein M231_02784 [Tremella mesenterica]